MSFPNESDCKTDVIKYHPLWLGEKEIWLGEKENAMLIKKCKSCDI